MKRFRFHILYKCLILILFPFFAGCSGSGPTYSVSGGFETAKNLISYLHGYLKPFVLALATVGVGYNAIVIIFEPASSMASENAVYIAKKRIVIIISAVIAFMLIDYVFASGF